MRFYSMVTPNRAGTATVNDFKELGVRSMTVTFEINATDAAQAMLITHRATECAGIGVGDVNITPINPPVDPW